MALALALVIATLGVGIAMSESQSRSRILSMFKLRGTSSATFVSTFLAQQADRERQTAAGSCPGPTVTRAALRNGGLGLRQRRRGAPRRRTGRALDTVPADPALTGKPIADRYAHLAAAEKGRVAVSGVVPSAVRRVPIAAVAVPFSTPSGRRVFSAAYPTSGSTLGAFVDHTIAVPPPRRLPGGRHGEHRRRKPEDGLHAGCGNSTPRSQARSGAPRSAAVGGGGSPRTFTVAHVPGTSWRLVIAVPDSRLFASIDGWQQSLPWVVFALVAVLAVALLFVVARLTALSERMAASARTDALTGLPNRRAVGEHLTRASARARRSGRPVSVLMIDLDRFKETNDRFGHHAGDKVLCAVADCMREALRAEDVYGRWGGDEFLVLLPEADETEAQAAAERLRRQAATVDLGDIGLPDGVPMSIGSATGTTTTPEDLVQRSGPRAVRAEDGSQARRR